MAKKKKSAAVPAGSVAKAVEAAVPVVAAAEPPKTVSVLEKIDQMYAQADQFKPTAALPLSAGAFLDILRILAIQESRLIDLEKK